MKGLMWGKIKPTTHKMSKKDGTIFHDNHLFQWQWTKWRGKTKIEAKSIRKLNLTFWFMQETHLNNQTKHSLNQRLKNKPSSNVLLYKGWCGHTNIIQHRRINIQAKKGNKWQRSLINSQWIYTTERNHTPKQIGTQWGGQQNT